MKALNILYWVSTILFAFFMGNSGVQNVMMKQEWIDIIVTNLGYPQYVVPMVGWAKILGVLGILLPVPPRLREWCYAGLFFDLIAAIYSAIAVNGFDPMMLTFLIPFTLMGLSY